MSRAFGIVFALSCAAALAVLSGIRYTAEARDDAVLRLTWRTRGERVRSCRRLTPEELARLPVHMRQEEVCERGGMPYRLRVTVDGTPLLDHVIRAGGASGDRPLFVFHELRLPPGRHRIAVTFERQGAAAEHEAAEPSREHTRETPPLLSLDESIDIGPRAIVLVTYDDEARALRLLAAPPRGP